MDTQVIYKVLSGTASPDERRAVDEWISKSNENKEEFNNLRLLWMPGKSASKEKSTEVRGFSSIRNIIEERIRKRKRQQLRQTVGIFLTIIVIALVPIFVLNFQHEPPDNYIRFEKADLDSVIRSIESNYHVKIEVERSEILTCSFTGTFYKLQMSEDVMKSLAMAMNLKCEPLSNNVYKLTGSGCTHS
jgi:hypothetical protein